MAKGNVSDVVRGDDGQDVKPVEGSKVRMALETLSPAQEAVVQKLFKSLFGRRMGVKGGNWKLDGVKVSLVDDGIRIAGVGCEQSGGLSDGRGRSLVEMSLARHLKLTLSFGGVTVSIPLNQLGAMTQADFAILFGQEEAENLTYAAIMEPDLKGDFDEDVAKEQRLMAEGIGEAVDAALARREK